MGKNKGFFLFFIPLMIFLLLSADRASYAYEKEIKAISASLSINIPKTNKRTVAVVDFSDLQGNVTELGRFLAEELSASLSEGQKGFEVVDRTHLRVILKEHRLSLSGLIDQKTAKKLGEIAGVEAIIVGTITPFGDTVRLAVKILDTGTAKVLGAQRVDIAKTKAIEDLLGKGVLTEGESVPGSPVPPISDGSKKYPSRPKERSWYYALVTSNSGAKFLVMDFHTYSAGSPVKFFEVSFQGSQSKAYFQDISTLERIGEVDPRKGTAWYKLRKWDGKVFEVEMGYINVSGYKGRSDLGDWSIPAREVSKVEFIHDDKAYETKKNR